MNPIEWLLIGRDRRRPVLLAVTPPRSGERTLLGVENLLGSIAVPEPFSLELAGDVDGVTLMARCLYDQVVRGQIAVRYPQARIREVSDENDPLLVGGDEQAWGMTLRSGGPVYAPLRTFRDEDLLDAGSDPLMAIVGSLSSLQEGERIVARAASALAGSGLGGDPPGNASERSLAAAASGLSGRAGRQPRGRGAEDGAPGR